MNTPCNGHSLNSRTQEPGLGPQKPGPQESGPQKPGPQNPGPQKPGPQ